MMMMTVRDIILVIYNINIFLNITNPMDDDDDGKGHYTVIYNTYIYLNITNPMDDDDDKGHYTSHI